MARETSETSREAREILTRINTESEGYLRPRDRNGPPDPDDWAEVWGRRIGRGLSAVIVIAMLIWLLNVLTTME